MPEPRAFKLRLAEERRSNYTGALPKIDRKRATAVLVRQSKTGADTAQAESRETQLGLQEYAKLLYGDDEPDVRLYDEGAGVSGQKRIDQREKLDWLYQDMHKGFIGTIITTGESRLFRDARPAQVTAFTQLAKKMHIALIIPPVLSGETRLYDFANSGHVTRFEEQMMKTYEYILKQIRSITPRTSQK